MDNEMRELIMQHLQIQHQKLLELQAHKLNIRSSQWEEIHNFLKCYEEFKQQSGIIRKMTFECLEEFKDKINILDEEAQMQSQKQQQLLEFHASRLNQQQTQLAQVEELVQQSTQRRLQIKEVQMAKENLQFKIDALKNEVEQKKEENQLMVRQLKLGENSEITLQSDIKEIENQKRYWNNLLQEVKGNIRVYCRIRPNSNEEMLQITGGCSLVLKVPERFLKSTNCSKESSYNFERIFGLQSDQEEVYNDLSDLIQNVVDGNNVCIFAYGQTGSGKTFTMQGDDLNKGVIPRAVEQIFKEQQSLSTLGWQTHIKVGFQEIYNESCRDLISNQKCEEFKLFEVKSIIEIADLFNIAKSNRQVAETQCNEASSRSHFIFQLNLQGHSGGKQINSTLNLIDLAGSERANVAKTEGDRFIETKAINKSLSALGDVFNALYTKQQHVPYRNSKLTFSLYKYMEGSSKTLMMVNVSAKSEDFQQTLASLRFAEKVKSCQIKK